MPLFRAHRWRRFSRAHFAAAFACLLLAACQTDDNMTTGAINGAPRAIAFDSIDGPPPEIFHRLVAQLSTQAETRNLPVVSRTNPAAWRVRLYLAAHTQKKQAAASSSISWVGDVYDARLNRAYRVSGEEVLGTNRKDVWALADNAVLARIAANSLDAIMSGARNPAPADSGSAPEPAAPQAAPNDAPNDTPAAMGTPMAALPARSAFADSGQ
ncbi:MAG TPA: hypothetical protein VNQ34_09185 [Xanthobacteraceae bacterium]|jgi:hypothetical protein|nr:hypothetical protein [Xanthobacteraceae bacterium]